VGLGDAERSRTGNISSAGSGASLGGSTTSFGPVRTHLGDRLDEKLLIARRGNPSLPPGLTDVGQHSEALNPK